jgi:hypothetical protein
MLKISCLDHFMFIIVDSFYFIGILFPFSQGFLAIIAPMTLFFISLFDEQNLAFGALLQIQGFSLVDTRVHFS